ncbi:class I SAM-dependent methyltransferase [Steroidobacter sp. S1-65]|uniref:Class I SAM-dependent methyltransferase n=1 Tax=Steroidobacter gossypii TaxID=2805490 RepID=A0ABS1WYW7_9GAMM|nr:class I SAM-dependent methyltransferase [Steroidobacter gossypii]MBM0106178.1 class I SAM-dependent methyltransferase [Steroidobacter gossypii]
MDELIVADDPLFRPVDIHARELYRFQRAFEATQRPTGKKILDIGAYPGTAFKVFGQHNQYQSFGITQSDYFSEFLRRNAIVHINESIESYRAPSDADIILFMEIIEHLRQPLRALQNLRAIAKPGALIYVTTNNASYYGYILKLIFGRNPLDSIASEASDYPGHTRYYGLHELMTEMSRAGFEIVSGRHLNLLPAVRFYRNRAFAAVKNSIGAVVPARYATHIEIVARA